MAFTDVYVHSLTGLNAEEGEARYQCRNCGKTWTSVFASSRVPCEPPITKVAETKETDGG